MLQLAIIICSRLEPRQGFFGAEDEPTPKVPQ
jgi:hypothetical protein